MFAAIGGWWLLDETYDSRTLLGCGLMLAGILASQSPRLLGRATANDSPSPTTPGAGPDF